MLVLYFPLCSSAAQLPCSPMIFYPNPVIGGHVASMQQLFPVLISIVHNLFARVIPDTTKQDRISNVKADLQSLRRTCLVVGIASAVTFQYIRYGNSTSAWLHNLFSAEILHPRASPVQMTVYVNDEYSAPLHWGVCLAGAVV